MSDKPKKLSDWYGVSLANLLADKILSVHSGFNKELFVIKVETRCTGKTRSQRIEIIADSLRQCLPKNYKKAVLILCKIMGEENPKEIGMYKEFYWLMPVGKFIEKYGLDDFSASVLAIEELTKRCTGEYAIRPYINKYPSQTIKVAKRWAKSENFHLRRLASEGFRPKLPWAPKLDLFVENPTPVFQILNLLKTDRIKFVKRSVANNLSDYLKVNPTKTLALLQTWGRIEDRNTLWIINYSTRKLKATS